MPRPSHPLRTAALALLASLAACGGEDAPKGGVPGAGPATNASSAAPLAPAPGARTGKPPLSPARLAELAGTEITGFRRSVISKQAGAVMLRYDAKPNAKGAYPSATVTLEPCGPCEPMDVATWKKIDWLRAGLPKQVVGDPELVFDVHAASLPGGRTGIGLYKEGIAPGPHEPSAYVPVAHGYQLWFNDGGNQIQIDVASMGALPRTRDEVRASISREDLAAAAQALYGAFAGEF